MVRLSNHTHLVAVPLILGTLLVLLWVFQGKNPQFDSNLNGISVSEAIERLGEPSKDVVFVPRGDLMEYRMGLSAIYDESVRDTIHIRELIWKVSNQVTVLWFASTNGTIKCVDNISWDSENVQF